MKKFLLFIGLAFISLFSISQVVTHTYTVSELPTDTLVKIHLAKSQVGWALTFKMESLTGTLDGEIALYYSANGTDTTLLVHSDLPFLLDAATENLSIEKSTLNFDYIHYKITKNNLTGGTITVYLNRKEY